MDIKVEEIKTRDVEIINKLLVIWEDSVRATHFFLEEKDITSLIPVVKKSLESVCALILAKDSDENPIAFMGIGNNTLEMLFVSSKIFNIGIGRKLLLFAMKNYEVTKLCVNEQNRSAKSFYERFGFCVYDRKEYDDYGNHFPVLYMKL